MGGLLSINKCRPTETFHVPHSGTCKRRKTSSSFWDDKPPLIPGLPDEISLAILARVPRICYLNVKAVSRSWKAAVTSPEIFNIRKELGTTEEWLYILTRDQRRRFIWHALDLVSKKWQKLPPIPDVYAEEGFMRDLSRSRMWHMVDSSIMRIGDTVRGWLGWKHSLDQFVLLGCSIGAVDGCLYLLGGFSMYYTMTAVWKYDPVSNSWSKANPMSVGRAYCNTGVLNNKLFVVGGISTDHDSFTPLQSAEVYDPQTGLWSDLPGIPFSKAQALRTAISTDLQPYATGLVSHRGKLYVPQGLSLLPYGFDVGGEVYDPETNSWVDMPTGMSEHWPAGGTNLSVNVDGDLYALGPSSSLTSAKLNLYNHEDDSWKVVDEDVPVHNFSVSNLSCLVACLLGKLHVITKDDNYSIAVMCADRQNDLITSSGEGASEPNIWNVITSMNSGYAELVSCQSLDI